MKQFYILLFAFALMSCNWDTSKKIPHGWYVGELKVNDQETLPFNFEVTSAKALKIFNADEVILVDDIVYKNDSVYIKLPVFEGHLIVKLVQDGMVGRFINETFGTKMPFKAVYNSKERFEVTELAKTDISGNWEVVFNIDSEKNQYLGKGVFEQKKQRVTGTFQTTTGDYRYLEGAVNGNQLKMSTFDGSRAYLFVATVTDSTMNGTFYSGNDWSERFEAQRNEAFELTNADTLTFLKEGYDRLEFSFPKTDGTLVSLNDKQFKDKVVVVQIMGTWCPNCLDETKYFSEFITNNSEKDVEFVALAFEYAKTESKAFESITELKNRLGIKYPILLAQFGAADKDMAQQKLPMLNQILSYPTTIILDKTGKVRKIHTGFNGPATGQAYVDFKTEFERFIDQLLAE